MGRAENSVMQAVEQLCGIYNVPCFRIQSRVIEVADKRKPGGVRPFFMGIWKDALGESHTGGMADMLLMPSVDVNYLFDDLHCESGPNYVTVPLWAELKAGRNGLSSEQEKFKKYVESKGAFYLSVRDSADPLIAWFREYGIIA